MFHSAFSSTQITRRWALVVVLCILLIYVYSSFLHRQYHHSNYANRNNNNNADGQPHNTERHAQRKVVEGFSMAGKTISINETVRIGDIVDAQRQKIASEMKDFNFTEQMVGLSALTPETNGQPLQSVILSAFRSGSTFFGDILNAMPGNYYHFEPLSFSRKKHHPTSAELIRNLTQLLKCNYTGLKQYLEYVEKNHYLFGHNNRLKRYCRFFPKFCFDPSFLIPFCRLFPFQSMKLVRLRANFSEQLLIDPSLNVKIVLSIRDPRGIIQSRKRLDWCYDQPNCDDKTAKMICKDMVSDFRAAEILTKKYPLRFQVIRYEDLSLEPFNVTKDILNFYGLPFHPEVQKFLYLHTRSNAGGPFSTKRDSKAAAFHWMRDLSFHEIDQIQKHCAEAMSLWGFKKADSKNSLRDTNFNPLENFPFASTTTATNIVTQEEQQSDENRQND